MMKKPKVFVTRRLPEGAQHRLLETCLAEIWPEELPPSRTQLLHHIRGVEGLLCLLTDTIDVGVMDAAGEDLKVISNCAVGVDNVDVQEATRRAIPVGHTPGILTETTADFAFALLMAAARRVVEADRFVREGKWKTWGLTLLLGQDVTRSTLGIIGFGRIGQALAKRAKGFDMRTIFVDPHPPPNHVLKDLNAQPVDMETLLNESDFISLHTPLTETTHHLIDRAALSKMKPTAILINTARGPVVDPQALHEALKRGLIAYAALDVTEPEPLPRDSPLLELDNLIVAPHIASASRATRQKMAEMAVDNLLAGLRGEQLPTCVNPEVYS